MAVVGELGDRGLTEIGLIGSAGFSSAVLAITTPRAALSSRCVDGGAGWCRTWRPKQGLKPELGRG